MLDRPVHPEQKGIKAIRETKVIPEQTAVTVQKAIKETKETKVILERQATATFPTSQASRLTVKDNLRLS